MQIVSVLRWGLAVTGLAMLSVSASAQNDPKDILRKASLRVLSARTYQEVEAVEVVQSQTSGENGVKVSGRIDSKMAGKKFRMEAVLTHKGGNSADSLKGTFRLLFGMDGHDFYYLIQRPSSGEYHKSPQMPDWAKGFKFTKVPLLPDLSDINAGQYTLLPPALVDGKPAYVIERVTSNQYGSGIMTYYIDQKTYRLRETRMTVAFGGQSMQVTSVSRREKLNAPIPDRSFDFVLPKNAHEMPDDAKEAFQGFNLLAMLTGGIATGGKASP